MTQKQRIELYDAWSEMDRAAQRLMTAQVASTATAAFRLEDARAKLREVVFSVTLDGKAS